MVTAVNRVLSRHRLPALVIVLVAMLTVLSVSALLGDRGSTALTSSDEPVPSATQTAEPSETDIPAPEAGSPEPTVAVSPPAPVEVTRTAVAAPTLAIDTIAVTLVDDLTRRSEADTGAERIGLLPLGEPAYVVAGPVEADGYHWYQLASVREPYRGACGDPAPEPSLECASWFGWAAGVTPDHDRWLGISEANCRATRDTEAYVVLLTAERLACAASDEWRLIAYVAPSSEGRGCYPVYVANPRWLDPSCNLLFLQLEESEYDSFEGLQPFVHPSCTLDADGSPCAFEALKGSWVELVGHLDDPAAETCAPILSSNFEEPPYPPPSSDEVVFRCRTRLAVTEVKLIPAPGG
jgi:hypothetical protein